MRNSWTAFRGSLLALIVLTALLNSGCGCNGGASIKSPEDYNKIVSTFIIGTIALETKDPSHTSTYLKKMTELAPEEPAGWANLGLFQLRSTRPAPGSDPALSRSGQAVT
jgi:hypothetical protein